MEIEKSDSDAQNVNPAPTGRLQRAGDDSQCRKFAAKNNVFRTMSGLTAWEFGEFGKWWAMRDSNSRHPRCKRGALPTELIALRVLRIMSAASVAVMYSDRKKTARAFMKFFCFFSGSYFPMCVADGQKAGTAGFLAKTEAAASANDARESSCGRPRLWTRFLFSLGKARKTRRLPERLSMAFRFFPIKMKKLILLS